MNLYEFNQLGYSSIPEMTRERLSANREAFFNWFIKDAPVGDRGKYWLLLNNELHYYTFYVLSKTTAETAETVVDDVIDLVQELGTLRAMEPTADKTGYEFWVTDKEGTTNMYMFFNYDGGVIEL